MKKVISLSLAVLAIAMTMTAAKADLSPNDEVIVQACNVRNKTENICLHSATYLLQRARQETGFTHCKLLLLAANDDAIAGMYAKQAGQGYHADFAISNAIFETARIGCPEEIWQTMIAEGLHLNETTEYGQ